MSDRRTVALLLLFAMYAVGLLTAVMLALSCGRAPASCTPRAATPPGSTTPRHARRFAVNRALRRAERNEMGNFKIEIEAVGGHGCDRTAKAGQTVTFSDGPDKAAYDFVQEFGKSNNVVSATLTHWPDSTPIVDDLKHGMRIARDFQSEWQGEPILQFFAFGHLPPDLQAVSKPFSHAAYALVATLPRNAERTEALRKLLEAKDAAVRALICK